MAFDNSHVRADSPTANYSGGADIQELPAGVAIVSEGDLPAPRDPVEGDYRIRPTLRGYALDRYSEITRRRRFFDFIFEESHDPPKFGWSHMQTFTQLSDALDAMKRIRLGTLYFHANGEPVIK